MTTPSSPVRERRDIKALEERRIKAGIMFGKGIAQAKIVRRFKVSRMAVSKWHTAWEQEGVEGLKSKGRLGRMPRLTAQDISAVRRAILRGPRKAGYTTDLWTLARIAKLIRDIARVSYHPSHVWKVLQSMNFSAQIPSAQPKERNERKIAEWKRVIWPQIQKRGRNTMPA